MGIAYLVAGMLWGDCAKGAHVEYLTRTHKADLIVRYNGGPQAAHNVVELSRSHTFQQFGSGMLQPNVKTYLSKFTLVNPFYMMREAAHLMSLGITDIWDRTFVDGDCLVVTPFQIAFGRLREIARGKNRHGSCGQGIGQTRSDSIEYGNNVLFAKDIESEEVTRSKLSFLHKVYLAKLKELLPTLEKIPVDQWKKDYDIIVDSNEDWSEWHSRIYSKWNAQVKPQEFLSDLLSKSTASVFEGAQGVMLDEWYGTYPYNSWTNTTFRNADDLLNISGFIGNRVRIGCIRTYATRHGVGPFPTEDMRLTGLLPENHNQKGEYQGEFRVGHLDIGLVNKSIKICKGVDEIALSHLDRWTDYLKIIDSEKGLFIQPPSLSTYLSVLKNLLEPTINTISFGPRFEDRMSVESFKGILK